MKKRVLLYQQVYLTISMTFIYRQLRGVSNKYEMLVCTNKTENLSVFPFEKLFSMPKTFLGKITTRVFRKLNSSYVLLSKPQKNCYSNVINEYDVELIHAHFGPGGLEVLPIAQKNKLPLLVTFHGYDASELLKNKVYVQHLKALFAYGYIITVSNYMKERLIGYGLDSSRCYVHYIGVPINDFEFKQRCSLDNKVKKKDEVIFLQVSNFVEKKGHLYTINAFEKIIKEYSNVKLIFAGDGILRSKMESLVREKKLDEKIIFVGKVVKEEVNTLMQESDIFLHHSVTSLSGDQEGIPTVLMEAMAVGLTVISTYHSGIPELIDDGVNGFLVEEKNVEQYVEKISLALSSDNKIRENARKVIVDYFNIEKQNVHLSEIYEEVLKK